MVEVEQLKEKLLINVEGSSEKTVSNQFDFIVFHDMGLT